MVNNRMGYDFQKISDPEYFIKTDSFSFTCSSYTETQVKVPLPSAHVETVGEVAKYVFNLFTGTHIFDTWNPNDEELEYANIQVLKIINLKNQKQLYIISDDDRQLIRTAMERGQYCSQCVSSYTDTPYKRACLKLFTENRYTGYHSSSYDTFDEEYFTENYRILFGYYKSRSYALSVDNLDSIISQFSLQDKKRELEAKKIVEQKEAEQRKKEEERLAEIERQRAQREAQRQAVEAAEAIRRKERLSAIAVEKGKYRSTISNTLANTNLLTQTTLSNAEKLEEYTALREFCIKCIPVLGQKGFQIESLHEKYPDYISWESCLAFKENWHKLCRTHSVLSRGAIGEKKVFEVLRLFDDRIRILRDFTWGFEHDFIIISPYGISTIEVKNLYGQYTLTETGILKCTSSPKVKPKDIALQSKKHLETLRRNLKGCPAFTSEIPLQEVICSAEPNFTIKDEYHYIPVCYYNTIDKVLLPDGAKVVLSNTAMCEIENFLLNNQRQAFRFDVFLPRGEIDSREKFIENFAEIASGFIVAEYSGI